MPSYPLYQRDAFADAVFQGNPAAVIPLDDWLAEPRLQAIAAENNLSETAFIKPLGGADWAIRWFTPSDEVELCGHASLVGGQVILTELAPELPEVRLHSRGGVLRVRQAEGLWWVSLPSLPIRTFDDAPIKPGIAAALGIADFTLLGGARDWIALLPDAAALRALRPDFGKLAALDCFAVAATAPGDSELDDVPVDFVSRFFAPSKSVPEDPVTGSLHCQLVPYWAARLGRADLTAYQASARGGRLRCRLDGDAVHLGGGVAAYLDGRITV